MNEEQSMLEKTREKGRSANENLIDNTIGSLKNSHTPLTVKNAVERYYDGVIRTLEEQSTFYSIQSESTSYIQNFKKKWKEVTGLDPDKRKSWVLEKKTYIGSRDIPIARGAMVALASVSLLSSLIVASLPLLMPMAVTSCFILVACAVMAAIMGTCFAVIARALSKKITAGTLMEDTYLPSIVN